ncbi:MAG: YgfZ/GcvT domain-containing protein [Bacteroidota bacterium]
MPICVPLAARRLLRVTGEDARIFLQGVVSNDVRRVAHDRAIWAAFLTPQGRYLHDFFLCELDGALILDAEAARLSDLKRRLSIYKLRSRVAIEEVGQATSVWALIGEGAAAAVGVRRTEPGAATSFGGGTVFVDPRSAAAGLRAVLPTARGPAALAASGFEGGDIQDYERLRIGLGLPDGSRDMLVEKSLLLECGFDELNGIDWQKGCYLGQELTARTRYRGLVKRRLLPVSVEGPLPPPGTPILLDGKDVGEVRSGIDGMALALLRLEALRAIAAGTGQIRAGETGLLPRPPDWAKLATGEQA